MKKNKHQNKVTATTASVTGP